jgi:hypothetical protein
VTVVTAAMSLSRDAQMDSLLKDESSVTFPSENSVVTAAQVSMPKITGTPVKSRSLSPRPPCSQSPRPPPPKSVFSSDDTPRWLKEHPSFDVLTQRGPTGELLIHTQATQHVWVPIVTLKLFVQTCSTSIELWKHLQDSAQTRKSGHWCVFM